MSVEDEIKPRYSFCCRVCLIDTRRAVTMTPLFTTFMDSISYSEMFYDCTGILNIKKDCQEYYPKNICFDCETQLLLAYKFKKKCLESDKKLSDHFLEMNSMRSEINIIKNDVYKSNAEFENQMLSEESCKKLLEECVIQENDSAQCSESEPDKNIKHDVAKQKQLQKSKPTDTDVENKAETSKTCEIGLCQICGKTFTKTFLSRHMSTHKENKEESSRFKCSECDKSYVYKSSLDQHMRLHRNEKPFECEYCHRKFVYYTAKQQHVAGVHTKFKKVGCHLCANRFHTNSRLQDHIRQHHTGELAYECDVCKKQFPTKKRVTLHKAMHSTERNLKCEYCGKGFGTYKTLRLHIKTHTGEKNYICPVCSSGFIQNHMLKLHIKRYHPDFPIPPPGTIISIKATKPQFSCSQDTSL